MGLVDVCLSSGYPYMKARMEIRLVVILDAFVSPIVIVDEWGDPVEHNREDGW